MSSLAVTRATEKGLYHDGGGLYLQVTASGAKSWIYRYMLDGRAREMGLGPLHVIPYRRLARGRPSVVDFGWMASIRSRPEKDSAIEPGWKPRRR